MVNRESNTWNDRLPLKSLRNLCVLCVSRGYILNVVTAQDEQKELASIRLRKL